MEKFPQKSLAEALEIDWNTESSCQIKGEVGGNKIKVSFHIDF